MIKRTVVAATLAASLAGCVDPSALLPGFNDNTDVGRWHAPIRLEVDRRMPAGAAAEVRDTFRALAHETGIPVINVVAGGNVVFRPGDSCQTQLKTDDHDDIVSASVTVAPSGPSTKTITRCINHETMHVLGFKQHSTGRESVLSYDPLAPEVATEADRLALRKLYRRY